MTSTIRTSLAASAFAREAAGGGRPWSHAFATLASNGNLSKVVTPLPVFDWMASDMLGFAYRAQMCIGDSCAAAPPRTSAAS